MAYREMHCVEIREVIRRWQAGLSQRRIASGTGLSRQTVRRYIEVAGLRPGAAEPSEEQLARNWWIRARHSSCTGVASPPIADPAAPIRCAGGAGARADTARRAAMTGIWRKDGEAWSLLPPHGFEDEAALHQRIAEAPEMLPLSGQPRLAVVGSEVRLGNGYADVIAVELEGRPVVIEVKLSRNAEARRAVVAQALAYAAYLHGLSTEVFETDILGPHLRTAGHDSLADAMRASDQEGAFDEVSFGNALAEHLRDGSFRVVFVLDEAPSELVRLAGYLETIADRIVVDLVTVSAYEVDGSQILLPQRVEPGRVPDEPRPHPVERSRATPVRSEGSTRFREAIAGAHAAEQASLVQLAEHEGVAAVGLGLTRVEVGGAAHHQPGHVRHRHAAASRDGDHELRERAGLVDDERGRAEGRRAVEERGDGRLVVGAAAGEERRALVVQHVGEVLGLADVEADPHGGFVGRTHCDCFRGFPLIPQEGRRRARRHPPYKSAIGSHVPIRGSRAEQCRWQHHLSRPLRQGQMSHAGTAGLPGLRGY